MLEAIKNMADKPTPVAVLFGRLEDPYIRIDPAYMKPISGDEEARRALTRIQAMIEPRLFDVVLEPGDLLVIDNFRAVHGRRPFTPRYDGTDRWLKRLNVTRDPRKLGAIRNSPRCRALCE